MALNYVLNDELFLSNCAYFVERTLGRYYPFFFGCQPAKRINDLKVTLYTITQFTTTQSENLRRKKSSVFKVGKTWILELGTEKKIKDTDRLQEWGNTFREMASLAIRGLARDCASRAVRAICAI